MSIIPFKAVNCKSLGEKERYKKCSKNTKKIPKASTRELQQKEIQQMTDEEILDMDYFLNEDDPFEELFD